MYSLVYNAHRYIGYIKYDPSVRPQTEASKRLPGGTQEAPMRHPGGTQEATRGDPGHPRVSRRSWEQKRNKTIVFYHRERRDRPFGVHETSATLTKYRK